jgi:hypothetical protein
MSEDFIKFNTDKLIITTHSSYKVDFHIYASDKDETDTPDDVVKKIPGKFAKNDTCFSWLLRNYSGLQTEIHSPNRIRFMCKKKLNSNEKAHLSNAEIRRWVRLCKKYGLMPKNIGENFVENGSFDIEILDISPNLLYVYLVTARYVQEEPHFVKFLLSLMKDTGLGFFTSFGVASLACISNYGHHIIPVSKSYGLQKPEMINREDNSAFLKFDLRDTGKLCKFLAHKANKQRTFKQIGKYGKASYRFKLADDLEKIKVVSGLGSVARADLPETEKVFNKIRRIKK